MQTERFKCGAAQGMLALNQAHDAQLFEQLQKFEAHVMQTCLHVPAGVVASAPAPAAQQQQLPWYGGEGAAEAQLAAQAAELARLRAELAMVRGEMQFLLYGVWYMMA